MDFASRWGDEPAHRILLGSNAIPPRLRPQVALQVELRRKIALKWPALSGAGAFMPTRTAFEQASSQATAAYKQQFVGPGAVAADLTGGLGMDFAALLSRAERGFYVEQQSDLVAAARYNLPRLCPNAPFEVLQGDALDLLPRLLSRGVSLIYADPARRDDRQNRLYRPQDTHPDPVELLAQLKATGYRGSWLFKLSPMADIAQAVALFPGLREIHLPVCQGELKELLLWGDMTAAEDAAPPTESVREPLQTDPSAAPDAEPRPREAAVRLVACELTAQGELINRWSCTYAARRQTALALTSAALPERLRARPYLHLPNPAVMKSGAFVPLAQEFGLVPVAPDTHLFLGHTPAAGFPGTVLQVEQALPFNKRTLAELRKRGLHASVRVRNFPLTAAELKQALRSAESAQQYLIGLTDACRARYLLLARPL